MKLLGISGTLLGAKTAILVDAVLNGVKNNNPDVEVELLDLRGYDLQFCDGRDPSTYNEDTRKIIEAVSQADFYLIGTPIFNGSIPAPLKNVFDIVPPSVFRNKVMGFVANGGTYQHYLVVENQLKPIAGYFRAFVAPSYVYAHNDHFNRENEIVDTEVLDRIHHLAQEMVYMQNALKNHSHDLFKIH
ncbi:NADPH-dependent FMN reductase [Neobacillus massiliamazoniensis]|uniref:NADH-dependent FMN reductase n=1 Tax=Neobacillus massiliamazoniensis TaxID=1499688 RepID=A0A0U1P018_9BACI|nr:NAD(P)H-dependent oxidoreductase [Neobacillus massiliamazoniensis]CRK83614.1 NADH-dependent FMN reductase [Neobacillus massiliamazoniensis]